MEIEYFEIPYWEEDDEFDFTEPGKSYQYTKDFLELRDTLYRLFTSQHSEELINSTLETLLSHYCKYKCVEEINE